MASLLRVHTVASTSMRMTWLRVMELDGVNYATSPTFSRVRIAQNKHVPYLTSILQRCDLIRT